MCIRDRDSVPHHGTYTYPRGLLRFELPQCDAASVDVIFNAAAFGSGWSWRFYGPSTPGDNSTMGWHDATSLLTNRTDTTWTMTLNKGQYGSYRPAGTGAILFEGGPASVSYTHLRAHETPEHLVCRLLL